MSLRAANKSFFAQLCGFFGVIKIASLCKVSFVFGSLCAFFSLSNVVTPLTGLYGHSGLVTALFVLLGLFKVGMNGFLGLHQLAFILPGLCASLYFSTNSAFIRLLLPIIAIAIFVVHPSGSLLYALYWLIPVGVYLSGSKQFFLHALSSTLIAHAVGSVIWLYTLPTGSAFWFSLLPVVALERLTFASGMVVAHRLVEVAKAYRFSLRARAVSTQR